MYGGYTPILLASKQRQNMALYRTTITIEVNDAADETKGRRTIGEVARIFDLLRQVLEEEATSHDGVLLLYGKVSAPGNAVLVDSEFAFEINGSNI